jgi:hypothetical protein
MKKDILREANYVYNFDREMYFNRDSRKVFSAEFIADRPEDEIVRSILEPETGDGWRFYSNAPLPESVKQELESVLA